MKMRTWFAGTLETRTALHIGTGTVLSTATNAPLLRGADGRPIIPGSSVKGALRSASERLLRSLGQRACMVFGNESSQDPELQCLTTNEKERQVFQKLRSGESLMDPEEKTTADEICGEWAHQKGDLKNREDLQLKILERKLCRACWTWGSPFLAGRVRAPDLRLASEGIVATEIRDGVGIDRDTGTAANKIKFDLEVLPLGAQFAFEVIVEPDADRAVVALAVGELLQGNLPLGGRVTRGLGDVKLNDFTIHEVDLAMPAQLVPYLTRGSRKRYGGEAAIAKLDQILGEIMEGRHAA